MIVIKVVDMTGQKVGNWIVLERDKTKKGKAFWLCQCQCEDKTIRSVSGINLRGGRSLSCGCVHNSHKENRYILDGDYGIGYTFKNEVFYFDLEDFEKIKDYYWYINSHGYPCTKRMKRDILMHRIILDLESNQTVDHIFHKPYDNRKKYLRIVTHGQNMLNKNIYKSNTSGYPGVVWSKRDQKWVVRIQINKRSVELGRYRVKDEAIKVRQEAEVKYYGEYRNKMKTK